MFFLRLAIDIDSKKKIIINKLEVTADFFLLWRNSVSVSPLSLASVQEQRLPNAASVDAEDTPPITPTTAQHSKVTAPLAPLARSLARSLLYLSHFLSLSFYLSIETRSSPIFRSNFFFAIPIKTHLSPVPESTAPPIAWDIPTSSPRSILMSRLNVYIHVPPSRAFSPSRKKKKKNREDIAWRWGFAAGIRESLILGLESRGRSRTRKISSSRRPWSLFPFFVSTRVNRPVANDADSIGGWSRHEKRSR